MNELALFAGAGGGILAGHMLGFRCICAVEIDEYARRVLLARQDDGSLKPFPIWDDIKTFDAVPWRGLVEVVSGGFPCTDISVAGRGAGIDGEASGLWAHMARVVRDVRPRVVFVENSPALTTRGLGRVLRDLAALGYDAEWGVLGADDVGANHRRHRIWIVAHAAGVLAGAEQESAGPYAVGSSRETGDGSARGTGEGAEGRDAPDPDLERLAQREGEPCDDGAQRAPALGANRRPTQPGVRRKNDGLARELDAHRWGDWRGWDIAPTVGKLPDRAARLRCLGNGQVPQCAAEAFRQLAARGGWAMNETRRP